MSIEQARPDFIAAQEVLSNCWPIDVLEALDTCVREIVRDEIAASKRTAAALSDLALLDAGEIARPPPNVGLAGQRSTDEEIAADPMLRAAYALSPTETQP